MTFRLLTGLGAVVVVASLAAGGCGGGGSSATPAAPSPPPSGSGASSTIAIVGTRGAQSFEPNPAPVAQGSTFAWKNDDNVTHHIVLDDGSLDSGDLAPGALSRTLTLGANGARYHCTIHPTMVGSINSSTGQPPPCQGMYCG
jgi:plastocyanin